MDEASLRSCVNIGIQQGELVALAIKLTAKANCIAVGANRLPFIKLKGVSFTFRSGNVAKGLYVVNVDLSLGVDEKKIFAVYGPVLTAANYFSNVSKLFYCLIPSFKFYVVFCLC